MLSNLAGSGTDRGKRIWLLERAVAEAVLFKPASWAVHLTAAAIVGMLLANLFVVTVRISPWAGTWPGAPYDIAMLLMGVGSVLAIAYTWYEGGHIRITFVRERCGPRARAFLDALAAFVFLVWFVGVTWGMWFVAQDSLFRGQSTMAIQIPVAPFIFVFCFIAGHFLLVLLRSFIGTSLRAAGRSGAEVETCMALEDWKAGRMIW